MRLLAHPCLDLGHLVAPGAGTLAVIQGLARDWPHPGKPPTTHANPAAWRRLADSCKPARDDHWRRQPRYMEGPPKAYPRYIRSLTCQYPIEKGRRSRREVGASAATRGPGNPGSATFAGRAAVAPTRQHHGPDRPCRCPRPRRRNPTPSHPHDGPRHAMPSLEPVAGEAANPDDGLPGKVPSAAADCDGVDVPDGAGDFPPHKFMDGARSHASPNSGQPGWLGRIPDAAFTARLPHPRPDLR
jgi:hypothetical protein